MSAFVLSPAARNDLHAIWDYIAGDSIEAADESLTISAKAWKKLRACQASDRNTLNWPMKRCAFGVCILT